MNLALDVMMGVYVVGALVIVFRRRIFNWMGIWRNDS